ncbi:uncharacterized protein LOC136063302 [Quercus suber]|uniref:uncharacterized protein LOC136063302 n=1 Tax=Quercus suber TaxID=58331 RepID=UPI0032E03CE3
MTESTASATAPTTQPWESTSSPYFLSNGDNPGVSLVVQLLTEENYNTWSRAILISLDAKTKLGFVDGSIPKPQSDHPYYTAWCKCNSTVLAWLFNSVSKELQSSIVYFKTARDVWLDLQYRFGQGNGPTVFDLRKEISSLTQEDLTINAYYTKFKGLWDEFSDYRTCTCGHQVEDCTMSFLMGLNETYAAVRGQILLLEPLPPLSKVFSLLLQDEKQRKVGAGKKVLVDGSSALAAFGSKPGNFKNFVKYKSGRPQCTHCGAMGHVVDKCYKLHGYPPGYKFKNKGSQPGQSFANNVTTAEDHTSEHVALTKVQYQQLIGLLNSQCHFGTQAPPEMCLDNAHQAATIITQPSQTSLDSQAQNISGICFSPSLEHSVFSSGVNTSHISPSDWILDSGATDHMVHSIHFFTSITSSVQISVKLPNGDMVKVTHIGTVKVSAILTLEHDLLHWKMIGLGKRHGGLYILQCTDSFTLPVSVSEIGSPIFTKISLVETLCT